METKSETKSKFDPIIFQCASDEKVPEKEKRVLDMPPSLKRAVVETKRQLPELKNKFAFVKTAKSLEWNFDRQFYFKKLLHGWIDGTSLEMEETTNPSHAKIRIAIEHAGDRRPWSYEGELAKYVAPTEPTLNLPHEALDEEDNEALQGVVLHQIGHALGLAHQLRCVVTDDTLSLKFADVDTVRKALGPKNTWKNDDVTEHILTKRILPTSADGFTVYDPWSIMIVPWNNQALASGYAHRNMANHKISGQDRFFIRRLYPAKAVNRSLLATKAIGRRNFLSDSEINFLAKECKDVFKMKSSSLNVTMNIVNSTVGTAVNVAEGATFNAKTTIGKVSAGQVVTEKGASIGEVAGGQVDTTGGSGQNFMQINNHQTVTHIAKDAVNITGGEVAAAVVMGGNHTFNFGVSKKTK